MNVQVSRLSVVPSVGERTVRIYRQAKSFGEAAHLLVSKGQGELSPGAEGLIAPMVMTSAFAIELFLKTLTMLSGKKVIPKHELLLLFKNLPAEARALIISECCVVAGRLNVEATLGAMNDAFDDWRYAHEPRPRMLMFRPNDALMLVKAIDNVCRSLLVARGLMSASD